MCYMQSRCVDSLVTWSPCWLLLPRPFPYHASSHVGPLIKHPHTRRRDIQHHGGYSRGLTPCLTSSPCCRSTALLHVYTLRRHRPFPLCAHLFSLAPHIVQRVPPQRTPPKRLQHRSLQGRPPTHIQRSTPSHDPQQLLNPKLSVVVRFAIHRPMGRVMSGMTGIACTDN